MTLKTSHKNTQKSDSKLSTPLSKNRQIMPIKLSFNTPYDKTMRLQRTIGNRAVGRLITSELFYDKLRAGKPNDKSEQEADRIAGMVMSIPGPTVCRQVDPAEEEDIQTTPILEWIAPLQRQENKEEGKIQKEQTVTSQEFEAKGMSVRMKARSDKATQLTPGLQKRILSLKGSGKPLPESECKFFEPRFGTNLSEVRIHDDSNAADIAESINANAFTIENNVVFDQGQFRPETQKGKQLIAHELTHVLQQTRGRDIIRREQVSPDDGTASETPVPESSEPTNSPEGVISELTDRELARIDRWLDQSSVGVEELNGQVEHDLDVITRAILCRRIPLEELLGSESDPGLCILEGATREDPRYQSVRQQVERGLRTRACGLVRDRQAAIERNRQLLEAGDIVEVRNAIGLSREPLIDEEFVCAVAMWQMLQGLSGNNVDGIVGPQTARTIGQAIEREAEELEERITEAEAEGEEIGQDREEIARLRAVAERFLVFATPALVTEMTAIVLSEGTEAQAEILAWVYYNILREQGVEGMRRASAGRYGRWYPGWVRVLRGERLPRYNFEKAQRVRRIVERVFAHREANPFPGLINHGNIGDINGDGDN